MHPINYSLILNLATLLISGALAWHFASPLLVVVAILTQTHVLQRFNFDDGDDDEEDDEKEGAPMGFLANVK